MPLPTAPFAGETHDTIRARMLTAVDDAFVKTEGGFVADTLEPAALGIEEMYQRLETYVWQVFPQLAAGGNLDALALQFTGLERNTGESDTSFRARVLPVLAKPSGMGTASDYLVAVASVPGTGAASIRSDNPGEVTVVFCTADHDAPDGTLIGLVEAAVNDVIPVGVIGYSVAGATIDHEEPFILTLTSGTTPAQRQAWATNIREWFRTIEPGADFIFGDLLNFAGIGSAQVLSWDFGGYGTSEAMPDGDTTFRASSVTVLG